MGTAELRRIVQGSLRWKMLANLPDIVNFTDFFGLFEIKIYRQRRF